MSFPGFNRREKSLAGENGYARLVGSGSPAPLRSLAHAAACRGPRRTQVHAAFAIPTETFELQFQSVARPAQVPQSPAMETALPVSEHLFDPAASAAKRSSAAQL